jgi:O-antigen/teichoic acid export membrane protein
VGRVLGATAVGQYSLGFRLTEILVHDLLAAAGVVLFAAFAMLSRSDLPRAVVAAYGYGLLLVTPIAVGIIILADPLVAALFGSRWHPVVPVVRILSVGWIGAPFAIVNGTAYMATRRIALMMKLAVPQGILLVVTLALFVRHGIAAAAGCQAFARLLFDAVGIYLSVRVLSVRVSAIWRVVWPPVAAAAGMAAVMLPVERAIASPWPALVTGVLVGGVTYLALVWLLARDELATLVRRARGGPPLWRAT